MVSYLIDTSALVRSRQPQVGQRIVTIGAANLHVNTPVLLEMGVNSRNAQQHQEDLADITTGMTWIFLTPAIEQRALAVQQLLAQRGQHRSARLADLLIAATAEAHHLTVLHYDHDFDLIAEVTQQPCEWIAPRGSIA